jgi:hypothetical protein
MTVCVSRILTGAAIFRRYMTALPMDEFRWGFRSCPDNLRLGEKLVTYYLYLRDPFLFRGSVMVALLILSQSSIGSSPFPGTIFLVTEQGLELALKYWGAICKGRDLGSKGVFWIRWVDAVRSANL